MKQTKFKAVEFMRRRREELSKLYFKDKTRFIDTINKNKKDSNTKLIFSTASKKHKV